MNLEGLQDLAARFPRGDHEGPGSYIRRLAQLAGMEPAEPGLDLQTGEPIRARLPYREPGDDDE